MVARRVRQRVGKINIERYQNARFAPAHVGNVLVRVPTKPLLDDGHGVVPTCPQSDRDLHREVLVRLELHPPAARISTMRSRASSAPYATAAETSSSVSDG